LRYVNIYGHIAHLQNHFPPANRIPTPPLSSRNYMSEAIVIIITWKLLFFILLSYPLCPILYGMKKFRARVGCFDYSVEIHEGHLSENHGDTDRDEKRINIFNSGNDEVVRETLQHELLHALMEDLFQAIKEIEKVDDQEEQFIRLFSPRLFQFALDNPGIIDYMYGLGDLEEVDAE